MSAVSTITVEKALASAKKSPNSTIAVTQKEGKPQTGSAATFYDIKWKIDGVPTDGWIRFEDVLLPQGMSDPADAEDIRNKYLPKSRMNVSTTVSKAGVLGEYLSLMNGEWKSLVESIAKTNDNPEGWLVLGKRDVHELVSTVTGEQSKKGQGIPIADPDIRMQIKLENYSPKHPIASLRGQPITVIQDYDKPRITINAKGLEVITYENATVDGQPITEANIHKFITDGSIIKKGRIHLGTCCRSAAWLSIPIIASRLVIQKGNPGGFDDDEDEVTDDIRAKLAASSISVLPSSPSSSSGDDSTHSQSIIENPSSPHSLQQGDEVPLSDTDKAAMAAIIDAI